MSQRELVYDSTFHIRVRGLNTLSLLYKAYPSDCTDSDMDLEYEEIDKVSRAISKRKNIYSQATFLL